MKKILLLVIVSIFSLLLVYYRVAPIKDDFVETINDTSFVMKAIPAGSFTMGCGISDEPCADNEYINFSKELRQHKQSVDAFYLAETETTWELYQLCIIDKACPNNDKDGGDNGWGKGTRPVIEVSWDDITDSFLPWLNTKTEKSYRLPTEAEWEYAARAGASTAFSWGNKIDCTKARYGYISKECGAVASTDPVKRYAPNAFGLYDMHGNVWEYVSDCWQQPSMLDIQLTTHKCEEYVLRGGSWLNAPHNLRSAARFHHNRTFRESGDGFRLALSVFD
jgi:formylglycine-generating enzyme required for sulfatase activity